MFSFSTLHSSANTFTNITKRNYKNTLYSLNLNEIQCTIVNT